MILSTTPTIEGKKIIEYRGLVTGEAIIGTNIMKDFLAGITDIIGGRSNAYEKSLQEAKEIAQKEMIEQAEALGCNAIIGIDIDYETVREGMLMVSLSGTAVKISE